ncbi:hypothetical protein NQ317_014732 [Molorchus minor]|uniref:Uncharacterized protein n=1 Tax=Molorchus minor TaxID=1323400 RepID=A0ABQ9J294_9CUCU|nr:hypothetical protein NQ317_014732 [Molorchus minor]
MANFEFFYRKVVFIKDYLMVRIFILPGCQNDTNILLVNDNLDTLITTAQHVYENNIILWSNENNLKLDKEKKNV